MLTFLGIIGSIILTCVLIILLTIALGVLGLFAGVIGYVIEVGLIIVAIWVVLKLVHHLLSKL